MIRPFRATACAVAILMLVEGCHPVPVMLAVGGALAAAGDSYCSTTSEPGRQALRDRLTGGRPLLACPAEGR